MSKNWAAPRAWRTWGGCGVWAAGGVAALAAGVGAVAGSSSGSSGSSGSGSGSGSGSTDVAPVTSVTVAVSSVVESVEWATRVVDAAFEGMTPWQVCVVSIVLYVVGSWVVRVLTHRVPLSTRIKSEFFRLAKAIPAVRAKIDAEIAGQLESMGESLFDHLPEEPMNFALPRVGMPASEVLAATERMASKGHVDWAHGKASGTVYHGGDEWSKLMGAVTGRFIWTNPLHADVFPGVRRMEAEVVSMTLSAYHGGAESCGVMTTGGTESILMACKAYRDRGRERGIDAPEMVVPDTIHAAFDKAAGYFGIHMVHVPVDPVTRRADVAAMAAAINRNTIFIGGSAPSYPHGIVDPIEDLAALAKAHDIGLHVDCCLGGFLVPFMADAGSPLDTQFDFAVDGVTTISADTHKYGYAPKGSSVLMFSSLDLRHYMYFVAPDWPGGIYASPGITGSRAGASVASTWAALMAHGHSGYVEATRKIVDVTTKIAAGVAAIPGIFVFGEPKVCVVGFGSNDFDIYLLSSAMAKLGWNLSSCQKPASLHLAVTVPHTKPGVADAFLADLAACTATLMQNPEAPRDGMGAIYGMAEAIPDRSLVSQMAHGFIDVMYRVDLCDPYHRSS